MPIQGIIGSQLPTVTSVEADDYLFLIQQVLTANGTKKITVPDLLKTGGKLLIVDGTNGSDTQGTRGSMVAYATLAAARTDASSGDTILVMPGNYTGSALFKDGVNWHFMPGTSVVGTVADPNGSATEYGIFDDRASGAVTCRITGRAVFTYTSGSATGTPNTTIRAGIYIQNASSDVRIQCEAIKIDSGLDPDEAAGLGIVSSIWGLRQDDGNVVLECDSIEDVTFGSTTLYGGGLCFRWGRLSGKVHRIRCNVFPIVCNQVAVPSGIAHCDLIVGSCENYNDFGVFNVMGGTTQDFRVSLRCGQMFTENSANPGDGLVVQGGGNIIFDCLSYTTPGAGSACVINDGNSNNVPVVTVDIGFVQNKEYVFLLGISGGTGSGPIVIGNCNQLRSVTTATLHGGAVGVFQASTVAVISGNLWKGFTGSQAIVNFNGGNVRIKGATIDNSSNSSATSYCVNLNNANGLILEDCTLIAHASNNSSIHTAAAATVKLYNNTYTNKAKAAGVTVQAGLGTLVVDAAVT